jgi:hypothetical protein
VTSHNLVQWTFRCLQITALHETGGFARLPRQALFQALFPGIKLFQLAVSKQNSVGGLVRRGMGIPWACA